MRTREDICELIATAFAGAQMPNSAAELSPDALEGPYVIEHFLGRSQVDVESNFLPSLHMEDLSYMTTEAIAYYLPAVLRLMLKKPYSSDLWNGLRTFLKPLHGERYPRGVRDLGPKQLHAISEWAGHLHDEWQQNPPPAFDPKDAKRALKIAIAYRQ